LYSWQFYIASEDCNLRIYKGNFVGKQIIKRPQKLPGNHQESIPNFISIIHNSKVLPKLECDKQFSIETISQLGLPAFQVRKQLPYGFKKDISCVGNQFKVDNACEGDSGSPVVRVFEGTARGKPYYEQHFIVSTGIDCRLPATIYVRVTNREILTWLQNITGNGAINVKLRLTTQL
jgi:hypothetical protein